MAEGIIASLIAGLILTIVAYVWKNRNSLRIINRIKLFQVIIKSGIIYFFYNHRMLLSEVGSIGDELKLAKKSFSYVGYTMSSAFNQDFENAAVEMINNNNINIELFILDLNSPIIDQYAHFFGISREQIELSLQNSLKRIYEIKSKLVESKKSNLKVYLHKYFISSSCFLIDINDNGLIHINFKFPKSTNFYNFGFLLQNGDFFELTKKSFVRIIEEIKQNGKFI